VASILFAWELGQGFGHIARMLPFAENLFHQGHEITWAARQPETARTILERRQIIMPALNSKSVLNAPLLNTEQRASPRITYCFSQMLQNNGYISAQNIQNGISQWQNIFDEHAIDLVVVDHSPTAIIAAELSGMPVIHLADGFTSPFGTSPLGPFLPASYWHRLPEQSRQQCQQSDRHVLNYINALFNDARNEPYVSLEAIFKRVTREFILSFPEFDHAGARAAHYCGIDASVNKVPVGDQIENVLVYLKPFPALEPLLLALSKISFHFTVHVSNPGISQDLIDRVSAANVIFAEGKVDLGEVGQHYDLVVNHGNHTTSVQALLAGIPLVCVPTDPEKFLVAYRVVENRLGVSSKPNDVDSIISAIHYVSDHPEYRSNARNFQEKYAAHDFAHEVNNICCEIASLLN
jgi:Erythromycin biosynthesis protein CIII-like, C-terminal domain